MKKEEIYLDDWQRILFGNAPAEFLLEVLLRSIIMFLLFTVVTRLLGKRMKGQLTQVELAVMLTLGAIIAPAIQMPDRGILLGALALTCALAFQRGVNYWGFKNSRIEKLAQGAEAALVKDGLLQLDVMASHRISRQQVFIKLRSESIYNLQQVERLYIEASGVFSIYTRETSEPGLSVLPSAFDEVATANWQGIVEPTDKALCACENCGKTVPASQTDNGCPVCQQKQWTRAVC